MAYLIEVMCIGTEKYALLERAINDLNALQAEFRFALTAPDLRSTALAFHQAEYKTIDIFQFLHAHRAGSGGHRRHIIAFIAAPLSSAKWNNLFGSHEAEHGLAVVTTSNFRQFVREEVRYCSYYLIRYALSFVNPHIKAHTDAERADCYFHMKVHKTDIRLSMDSGNICDGCRSRLDAPLPEDDKATKLSGPERIALARMRQYVAGQLPVAIIAKGGGVKGLAFAGALLVLENHYSFDRYVGTSAGAIAAALMAAGYSPKELHSTLLGKNFLDFLDAPWWKLPINAVAHWGFYPGKSFELWIDTLLRDRVKKIGPVTMADLAGLRVYGSQPSVGVLPFDSAGERHDSDAAFAVRCSMSIPGFFFPMLVDGRRVYDGGLRVNFPLASFLDSDRRPNFLALFLSSDRKESRSILSDLLSIVLEGEERGVVDAYSDRVVKIDTTPVDFADFWISNEEKKLLIAAGKTAALKFVSNRNLSGAPSAMELILAEEELSRLRGLASTAKKRRRSNLTIAVWSFAMLVAFFLRLVTLAL